MAERGCERVRPKPESFSVAGVSPLGASGPRGWKASPGDHRDEFIPNTGPPHSEGLSLHACPMCRAYLYSNSHLFLLPMTFQQGIPKLSGLNRDLFIFFSHPSWAWTRAGVQPDVSSAPCGVGWCLSLTRPPLWPPALGLKVPAASLTFGGPQCSFPWPLSSHAVAHHSVVYSEHLYVMVAASKSERGCRQASEKLGFTGRRNGFHLLIDEAAYA